MSAWEALEAPMQPDTARERWRLHRAGIINVYQYENEVLHFGGGRLLLRGVNGSGKSMAMNMLFAVPAHRPSRSYRRGPRAERDAQDVDAQ